MLFYSLGAKKCLSLTLDWGTVWNIWRADWRDLEHHRALRGQRCRKELNHEWLNKQEDFEINSASQREAKTGGKALIFQYGAEVGRCVCVRARVQSQILYQDWSPSAEKHPSSLIHGCRGAEPVRANRERQLFTPVNSHTFEVWDEARISTRKLNTCKSTSVKPQLIVLTQGPSCSEAIVVHQMRFWKYKYLKSTHCQFIQNSHLLDSNAIPEMWLFHLEGIWQ